MIRNESGYRYQLYVSNVQINLYIFNLVIHYGVSGSESTALEALILGAHHRGDLRAARHWDQVKSGNWRRTEA